jgi:hypothetical protein
MVTLAARQRFCRNMIGDEMAQFYGTLQGARGPASRLGHKSSGLTADVNGWNVGARVEISHENGHDVVRVYRTSGSNARHTSKQIAEFSDAPLSGVTLGSTDWH